MKIILCIETMCVFIFTFVLAGYLLAKKESPKVFDRLIEITRTGETIDEEENAAKKGAVLFAKISKWLQAHLGLKTNEELRQRFARAGLKGELPGDLYQTMRILGPIVAIVGGSAIPFARAFMMTALPAIVYLAPDLILGHLVQKRRERIRMSIPDFIDLLVICVDAGLGLDQAMLRVGQELSLSHPEINEEILHLNRQQRAGSQRSIAWQGMADRVRISEIDSLVNMLLQTERFGTPIAKALSNFAEGVRLKRLQAAEEMAAKSTVKIIFPLVFFIFPPVFIVLLAPAALNIARMLGANPR